MRVLLVEDDDGIRQLMEELLREEHGHVVDAFASGEEAWAAWEGWRRAGSPAEGAYPLALLDWMLPGEVDGLELCRRMRADGGRDTVVLVVTARSRPSDLREVLAAGADDYLAKPMQLDLLNVRLAVAARRVEETAARMRAEEAAREAARLEGVLLAARTAAHEVNNALALPVGYGDLLLLHPTIRADAQLAESVAEIVKHTMRAADAVTRLQRVVRLEEASISVSAVGPILDIGRSTV